ncbi:MAG: gliding motility-associated C-terminal domain-containing protein [Bernardetiaceae bacterium]|nr:gliding motility-associated C-terminal domain-containing protein [Bernardetiaceae bacterium]
MKHKYLLFIFCFFAVTIGSIEALQATHVRAGDLTAVRISASSLTYRITATIYTDDSGVAPDPEIEFRFGTGDTQMAPRGDFQAIGNATTKNTYQTTYTFPGPGEYSVGVLIRNRNPNIRNIPGSVNVPFYLESIFLINPFLGENNSPVLLVPPIDFASRGQIFIHNPGAYDADGDSLAYRLTICKKNAGENVDGYTFPDNPMFNGVREDGSGPAVLTLDPITGDLIWDAPGETGQYNVAFIVEEWRDGVLIGQVNRDMQIIVRDNPNETPRIAEESAVRDTCVVAGTFLQDTIVARDADGDFLIMTSFSALYQEANILEVPPRNYAQFRVLGLQPPNGEEKAVFSWQTVCEDVRIEPYLVTHKVEDEPPSSIDKLADLRTWRIRVVGPAPDTLIASIGEDNESIILEWESYQCPNAEIMTVWRRIGSFDFVPDNCETGLPAYTGYTQIGDTPIGQTRFVDDNNGEGLQRGTTYCYRIYAVFPVPGGGESYVSQEVCITIPSNAPYIINVSVEETETENGEMFVRWTQPIDIDSTVFPPPYSYELARADGFGGLANWTQIGGRFDANDTTFTDTAINTEDLAYNYRVYLFSNNNMVDSSATASSVRLAAEPLINGINLSWQAQVPWTNVFSAFPFHYIYKESLESPGVFELIDSVNVTNGAMAYRFSGTEEEPLNVRQDYCFYVETQGTYNNAMIREPLLNKSQIICARPIDDVPPCAAFDLTLDSLDCNTLNFTDRSFCEDTLYRNELIWQNNYDPECDPEIAGYNIYFTPHEGEPFELLTTITDTVFVHEQFRSLAGCYYVTLIDFAGNESEPSNQICNDNCPNYSLPNVFTPNGDGQNDVFRPFDCPAFVERVDFRVFNRWGAEVYSSSDNIFLDWDGRTNNGNLLPSGVYYYEAKVKFFRLRRSDEVKQLKGWIQILYE